MADHSLEKENTNGFGWFKGSIEKINNVGKDYLGRNYKIPHMGWNNLEISEKKTSCFKKYNRKRTILFYSFLLLKY
jgi:glutamine amidotransferase